MTLRSSIERSEALDTGAITMTDLDPAAVPRGIRLAMPHEDLPERSTDYGITNASKRS